jgi:molybdopterin-guanine dinucleotide biosynthesis protein A
MDITGLIVAGGLGVRMGSVDKGLQTFRSAPLIEQVIQRLAPQVQYLLINANRNPDIYKSYGVPVLADTMPDFAGPLAGLQTGLVHCKTLYLAMVPCDSPFLPNDLVVRLRTSLEENAADLSVVITGEAGNPQIHPVFCLMKTSVLPDLTSFLQGGRRKMQDWIALMKVAKVHFPDDTAFRNINTFDDLRNFEAG